MERRQIFSLPVTEAIYGESATFRAAPRLTKKKPSRPPPKQPLSQEDWLDQVWNEQASMLFFQHLLDEEQEVEDEIHAIEGTAATFGTTGAKRTVQEAIDSSRPSKTHVCAFLRATISRPSHAICLSKSTYPITQNDERTAVVVGPANSANRDISATGRLE